LRFERGRHLVSTFNATTPTRKSVRLMEVEMFGKGVRKNIPDA
jgi:hypothetical protein